jgi:hypothetical protein
MIMRGLMVLIVLFLSPASVAFGQFAFSFGSSGQEYGKAIAIDGSGNPIVAALFQYTIDIDPNGTSNLQSNGGVDVVLVKYTGSGSLVWGKRFGGTTTTDAPHGVGVDGAGNIFVTGYFGSQMTTAPQTANFNPNGGGALTTKSDFDAYLAKYDSNGNYRWALGLGNSGGNTEERGWDIAVDAQGNSYIAGAFHGTVDFNPRGTPNIRQLASPDAGLFLAKYDSSGINQWAIVVDARDTSVFTEAYAAVDFDAAGNVYFAGNFRGTNVNFDPQGSALMTSAGQTDMFLAKYTTSGTFVWAKRIGGPLQDIVSPGAMRLDNTGLPWFTGRISGTVNFNTGGGTNIVTGSSLFLAGYDASGQLRTAFGMPSNPGDGGHRVDFDVQNNVYVAGWMNGTVDFDPNGTYNVTAVSPTADVFLAKYTNNGGFLWAFSAGAINSSQNNICAGLVVDAQDNAFITGQFYGTNADFDPSLTGQRLLSSVGQNDCFVAKYNANGTFIPVGISVFEIKEAAESVTLHWRTESEINNAGFEIQRSLDRNTFASIGYQRADCDGSLPRSYEFVDCDNVSGKRYYRLKQIDNDGSFMYSHIIEADPARLDRFSLLQNYPNPFSSSTVIPFFINGDSNRDASGQSGTTGSDMLGVFISLKICDILGRDVATLLESHMNPGEHTVIFHGSALPEGTYLLRLTDGYRVAIRPAQIIR